MRVLHFSDLHYSGTRKEEALESLGRIIEVAENELPIAIISSGDFFDVGIQNSSRDGFGVLLDAVARLLHVAPVFSVYGTPTHDVLGCYEAFERLDGLHPWITIDSHRYWVKDVGCEWVSRDIDESWSRSSEAQIVIMGCPEPSKAWFLSGNSGVGKDEAREAIERGMRNILLGLGSVRKRYPGIPAVMVYHGSVRGATMANGQMVPQAEIAIGRDDLALVGADYYALGHIHLRQRIPDLPAYYAGSAYPKDWGERDRKTFNIVDLSDQEALKAHEPLVEHHQLPHPPLQKIVLGMDDGISEMMVAGCRVWVVRRVPDGVSSNTEPLEAVVRQYAEPGSRVTVEIVPAETVRAAEIREAKTLKGKVRTWAEASGLELAESVYDKAETLETEARTEGVRNGAKWRVDRLRLRGAIGIWKNSQRDEIEIDLREYDRGLIALVGPNGAGKSTLIENLHPYPQLLTRCGKLQDHFRLRDSYRDLTVTDEVSGDEYRFLLLINGATATGGAEYWIYRNNTPIVNGRKADYESKVSELFGSIELYLRSAFVTQKATRNNPDLADATQGEKKAIFAELSGIDYLQEHHLSAREKARTAEDEQKIISAKLEALPAHKQDLLDESARLAEAESDADQKARDAAQVEVGIIALRARITELKPTIEQISRDRARAGERAIEIEKLAEQIEDAQSTIAHYEEALKGKAHAESHAVAYEKLRTKLEELKAQRTQALEARNKALIEYNDRAAAHRDALNAYQRHIENSEHEQIRLDRQRDELLDRIDELVEQLRTKTTCPKCGHEWAHDEEARTKKLELYQQKVCDIDVDINHLIAERESYRATQKPTQEPTRPEQFQIDDAQERRVAAELARIDIERARFVIEEAQKAESTIAMLKAENRMRLEALSEKQAAKKELLDRVTGGKALEDEYGGIEFDVLAAERERERIGTLAATYRAKAAEIDRNIAVIKTKIASLEPLEIAMIASEKNATEWRMLERACGPNGIQALELDALAPSITAIANRLLSSTYGARFLVKIETTRTGGNGSKVKQIEDFRIVVRDTERNAEQELDTLSGGESVWIKKALYDAFGIIRAQNTGIQFATVMLDEADGALDSQARERYLAMIEAAHQESERAHTIVITHSREAQQRIPQSIQI